MCIPGRFTLPLDIVAVKSKSNGKWGYGPRPFVELHPLLFEYAEEAPYVTAEEALETARKDDTVPKGATFGLWHP